MKASLLNPWCDKQNKAELRNPLAQMGCRIFRELWRWKQEQTLPVVRPQAANLSFRAQEPLPGLKSLRSGPDWHWGRELWCLFRQDWHKISASFSLDRNSQKLEGHSGITQGKAAAGSSHKSCAAPPAELMDSPWNVSRLSEKPPFPVTKSALVAQHRWGVLTYIYLLNCTLKLTFPACKALNPFHEAEKWLLHKYSIFSEFKIAADLTPSSTELPEIVIYFRF